MERCDITKRNGIMERYEITERVTLMEIGDILERMISRGGMAIVKRGDILERGDIISWRRVTIRTPTMYLYIRASFFSALGCGFYLTWKNNNTSSLFYKGVLIILPEKGQQQLLSCIDY